MASGFLILADGRCLARRWWAYDAVIKAVAEQLGGSDAALALREWLLSLLPGPDDEQHIGYGPWLRAEDNQLIERRLDIRELTVENQRLFHDAALEAAQNHRPDEDEFQSLSDLSDMLIRADRGEAPLSRSDCRQVPPALKAGRVPLVNFMLRHFIPLSEATPASRSLRCRLLSLNRMARSAAMAEKCDGK